MEIGQFIVQTDLLLMGLYYKGSCKDKQNEKRLNDRVD